MACWTASAKWALGPALDGQRDMPLGLSLSEGLGVAAFSAEEAAVFISINDVEKCFKRMYF